MMSAPSGTLAQKDLAVESVKRKLDFDDLGNCRTEAEFPRALARRKMKGRRLDFGETDPSVLLRCPDLLPNRCDFDSVTMPSQRYKRTVYTAEQKSTLEATFRNKMYLSREEKAALASKLNVGIAKVQDWFKNRRIKWRKEQQKDTVGRSGCRPIRPRAYLVTQKQLLSQPLCPPLLPAIVQPASASQQMTQSYAANSSWEQLYPKKHLPVPPPSSVNEVRSCPFQQGYPRNPGPVYRIPQRQPESSQLVQHTTAAPHPIDYSLPLVKPVEQNISQLPAVESRRLADEFPFSYAMAKELPHIFGNLEEDENLHRPLTPSFNRPSEHDPLLDPLAQESDHTRGNQASPRNADFVDCVSTNDRRVQPSWLNSCCFGNGDLLSPLPLRELSYGVISKGRSFRLCRQE